MAGSYRSIDIKINYRGMHEVLTSAGCLHALKIMGEHVASAVRQNPYVVGPVTVREGNPNTGGRGHVWVTMESPAAQRIEAKHRPLGSAIDAMRG